MTPRMDAAPKHARLRGLPFSHCSRSILSRFGGGPDAGLDAAGQTYARTALRASRCKWDKGQIVPPYGRLF